MLSAKMPHKTMDWIDRTRLKVHVRAVTAEFRGAERWPTSTILEACETFVKTKVEFIVNSPDHQ